MLSKIRKISIGSDYKNEAMHYSVGQSVYGGHTICDIINDQKDGEYLIYIKIVHHNIFRRWYDVKGKERNSRSYFNEDLYFCSVDQIYLYYDKKWRSFGDRCFVNPIKNQDKMSSDKTVKQEGFIKYDNKLLNHLDIFEGDLISFKPEREFEFVIENELLYCMKSRDIIIKHEDEGNKEKYNPSWAFSSERTDKSSKRRDCKHRGGCVCGSSKKCCRNKETSNI